MSTNAGMRPAAASSRMRPVGVGLTSRGPIGVEGLTVTTGNAELRGALAHGLLGQELRALVVADHVVDGHGRVLVGRRAILVDAEHGDARRVDHARRAGGRGRLEHVDGAFDVGAVHRLRIRDPEPIVGRDVKHGRATRGGAAQRVAIREVAVGDLDVEPRQIAAVAARAARARARPCRPRAARARRRSPRSRSLP